ncbi:glycine-rich cell wall structural protein 1.0-like [Salvia miltiorrhiza]|uniref:glycine-rich cell wall structural protein 1.0-like n=1 Tax=Salvia miltiorrhiza TaxID=226208 RepID=UPI0025ABE5F7|nr:glycine-rich cell wall structural protein 1.0-like [Salvia miltiorrhiza]
METFYEPEKMEVGAGGREGAHEGGDCVAVQTAEGVGGSAGGSRGRWAWLDDAPVAGGYRGRREGPRGRKAKEGAAALDGAEGRREGPKGPKAEEGAAALEGAEGDGRGGMRLRSSEGAKADGKWPKGVEGLEKEA